MLGVAAQCPGYDQWRMGEDCPYPWSAREAAPLHEGSMMAAQQRPLERNPPNMSTNAMSMWDRLPAKSPCPAMAACTPRGAGRYTTNTMQVPHVRPRKARRPPEQLSLPAPTLPTFTNALIFGSWYGLGPLTSLSHRGHHFSQGEAGRGGQRAGQPPELGLAQPGAHAALLKMADVGVFMVQNSCAAAAPRLCPNQRDETLS